MNNDVVIIGGGITGLTTAYFLAKNNRSVHLYDQTEKLGSQLQASSVNCGIICSSPHTGSPIKKALFTESLRISQVGMLCGYPSQALRLIAIPKLFWGKKFWTNTF